MAPAKRSEAWRWGFWAESAGKQESNRGERIEMRDKDFRSDEQLRVRALSGPEPGGPGASITERTRRSASY
jgi:hypothetical protein